PAATVYACGPDTLLAALERSVPACRLHTERFTPRPRDPAAPFTVELRESGEHLHVPADHSLPEVVRRHVPTSTHPANRASAATARSESCAAPPNTATRFSPTAPAPTSSIRASRDPQPLTSCSTCARQPSTAQVSLFRVNRVGLAVAPVCSAR